MAHIRPQVAARFGHGLLTATFSTTKDIHTMNDMRSVYLENQVNTASAGSLLVMLYDRLLLDLDRAAAAIEASKPAGPHLTHAQDIISELISTLDVDAWDGAAGLMSLYTFILGELISANVTTSLPKIREVRALIEPLRDAWSQAAAATAPTHTGALGVA